MNEKENFVIEDLDDHHLVIKAEHEWRVRQELETEVMLLVLVAFVSLICISSRRIRTVSIDRSRLVGSLSISAIVLEHNTNLSHTTLY